jgi:hypothetical protein
MENSSFRSAILLVVATVVGGILVFMFQEIWRDKVNLVVEVVPSSMFRTSDVRVTEFELENLEKLQAEKGVFGEDSHNFNQRRFREDLAKLIVDKKAQLRTSDFECAYLITLNNNGSLPAEDVFVRIRKVKLFGESNTIGVYNTQQLLPANNETILLGQVKQGVTKTVLAFASDYGCAYSTEDLAAGHRLGTAKLRYAKIPFILPNWVTDYPNFSFFYICSFAGLMLLILFAIVGEMLKKSSSSKNIPSEKSSEITTPASNIDLSPPT